MKRNYIPMFLSFLFAYVVILITDLFGYLSDSTDTHISLHASNLNVEIKDFQIGIDTPNGLKWHKHNESGLFDIELLQDDIIDLVFTVENKSSIDVCIDGTVELYFVNERKESALLILYPQSVSHQQIRENSVQNRDSAAVIGLASDDTKIIQSPYGQREGIREQIVTDTLTTTSGEGHPSKQYAFKLFVNQSNFSPRELRSRLVDNKVGINIHIQAIPLNQEIQWDTLTSKYGEMRTDLQIPPTLSLTLVGDNPMYVTRGSKFSDPGATAKDEYGDPIEVHVSGSVDTSKYGPTVLEYKAEHDGLLEVRTRTVYVMDDSPPVITPLKTEVEQFSMDNFPLQNLVSLSDNVDTPLELNEKLEITTPPGYSSTKPGVYPICYNVTDNSGLKAIEKCIKLTIFGFKEVAPMQSSTLALTTHGHVYSWGYNGRGQAGRGSGDVYVVPSEITTLKDYNIIQITAGKSHGMALSDDGRAFIWGDDDVSTQGNGEGYKWNPIPVEIKGIGKIVQIDSKDYTSIALNDAGDVYSWGYALNYATGLGTRVAASNPTKMSFPNNAKIKYVSMGVYNGYAISVDNQLYSWGYDGENNGLSQTYGNSPKPKLVTQYLPYEIKVGAIKQIELGEKHTYLLLQEGIVYAWGLNNGGQLADGTTVNKYIPTRISYFKENNIRIDKIEAGHSFGMALDDKGTAYAWGRSEVGAFGKTDTITQPFVLDIGQSKKVTSMGAHRYTSGLVTSDGYLYMIGNNSFGQLGINESYGTYTDWKETFHP